MKHLGLIMLLLGCAPAGDPPRHHRITSLGGDPGETPTDTHDAADTSDMGDTREYPDDAGDSVTAQPLYLPILFVHGINGSADDFTVMKEKLVAEGFDPHRLFSFSFDDPMFGCNSDNAETIAAWVQTILTQTGSPKIVIVAHSMGSLSSRYFAKFLDGTDVVDTLITLGGMNHGLWSPCLSPLEVCVWKELCETGPFVGDLNAPPPTPGPTTWYSIYSSDDATVPATSSYLEGATNIEIEGVDHAGPQGLLENPVADEALFPILETLTQ